MTRPGNEPIELTTETQLERLRERFSRRQLLQLAGASGASFVAGCGGGGQGEASPTATATGAPAQETATATATPTPAGGVEVTDHRFLDTTGANFEQLNANPWNKKTGGNLRYQQFPTHWVPPPLIAEPTVEGALDVIVPMAAESLELDTESNVLTMNIRKGLSWGSGDPFTAEDFMAHADLLKAQVEVAREGGGLEVGEVPLPTSIEMTDEYTVENQLPPGNAILRMFTTLNQGNLGLVHRTQPELHAEFIQRARDATTVTETTNVVRDLITAKFPAEDLPKLALGGFKAREWDPGKLIYEARPEFPWGLGVNDVDRVFGSIRVKSIGEQTQPLNAAVGGEKSYIQLPNKSARKRLGDAWEVMDFTAPISTFVAFSPKSIYGRKTERSRNLRKGIAYLLDSSQFAAINDLDAAYEQTTGFTAEEHFKQWIGEDTFGSWTNYGKGDTGYVFKQKGYDRLRTAGYERNKNGVWEGNDGPLAPQYVTDIARGQGLSRPVVNNIVEQLNEHGIRAEGKIVEGGSERHLNVSQEFTFDLMLIHNGCEVHPHPINGYLEDCGLGSKEGLPATIAWWDWRNGYKRVEVPMPVGDPDGEMTTVNYDEAVLSMAQLETQEAVKERVRKLAWLNNQWVPVVYLVQFTSSFGLNTDQLAIREDVNSKLFNWGGIKYQLYAGFFQPPA